MKKKLDYREYPAPVRTRSGAKVGWYYSKREDAEACAVAAKHNARIQAGLGFDFGYQAPGSISKVPGVAEVCEWEVCIP